MPKRRCTTSLGHLVCPFFVSFYCPNFYFRYILHLFYDTRVCQYVPTISTTTAISTTTMDNEGTRVQKNAQDMSYDVSWAFGISVLKFGSCNWKKTETGPDRTATQPDCSCKFGLFRNENCTQLHATELVATGCNWFMVPLKNAHILSTF